MIKTKAPWEERVCRAPGSTEAETKADRGGPVCWLAFHGLLTLLWHTPQDHLPVPGPTYRGLRPPLPPSIQEMPPLVPTGPG